jgi:hypothetical protein
MLMSTTTIAVPTTAVLAAQYIAETNAFLNEYWDCPFARWPLKQDTGARAGARCESDAARATVDPPPADTAPRAIAVWTLLCLPALAVEGESQQGMSLRLVLVFREPEPPPPDPRRAPQDVWEMRLTTGAAASPDERPPAATEPARSNLSTADQFFARVQGLV